MTSLLDLSHEILQSIFSLIEPSDLAPLDQCCKSLHAFIRNNKVLHRDLYLGRWDHPTCHAEPKWEELLHRTVRLEKILRSQDETVKRDNLKEAAALIVPMLSTADTTLNTSWLASHFDQQDNQQNIDCFLASSSLFRRAGTTSQQPAASAEERELSAKLHCYYGIPLDFIPRTSVARDGMLSRSRSPYHIIYPRPIGDDANGHDHDLRSQNKHHIPSNHVARARVYDLRQYSAGSFWGPFKDDWQQTVDWEKLEAVMVVLGYNMRLFFEEAEQNLGPLWNDPWYGVGPNSFVHVPECKLPAELGAPGDLDARDPYGITGAWMRVVCFLDYNELRRFNTEFPVAEGEPRQPIDTLEAIRLIKLNIRVTKIEPPKHGYGQDLPVVSFRGSSQSMHSNFDPNANSRIKGVVGQTPAGEIGWTTWSIFRGEERWRSEGIQMGGIRSARGVLGNWFDKDYDPHGPAGPTAFWKTSDDYIEEKKGGFLHTFPFVHVIQSDDEEDEESDDDDDNDNEDAD